jgi:anti-sigma factor RsiW
MSESHQPNLSAKDEADLVAMADGRLEPARRATLEARLAAEPELAGALDRQRAALSAITAATERVAAPPALRARIEAMAAEAAAGDRTLEHDGAPSPPRTRTRPSLRERLRALIPSGPLLPVAGLAAAAAIALVVVVAGGGNVTVNDMLAAATRPPTATVQLDPNNAKLLDVSVGEVPFPNFEGKFPVPATGRREDTIDDRDNTTVFYERDGRAIAYTIVAGEALPWPDGEKKTVNDVEFRTFEDDGRTVVTWRRGNKTCVMSAEGVPEAQLLELASWNGMGDVPF